MGPACELQHCSSRQQESRWDADLAVVTTDNCSTITEERGSPLSLNERTPSAVVTYTSCTSGCLCQSLEAVGGQKGTPATKSPAGRKRRNRKRATKTTKHATAGNNRSTLEASRVTAQRPTETTEGTVSLRDPAVTSVIGGGGATKIPRTEETLLPINPVPALAGDGNRTGRKATTAITDKQERDTWEVDVLMCERAVEKETEQADNQSPSTRQDQFVESAEHRTGEFLRVLKQWS